MSNRRFLAALATIAIALAVAPHASAALWSSTNTVARMSETTTMEISVTGDQTTVAGQVDVVVPSGVTNVVATPLNGASCAYISASRVVRVFVFDWSLLPLPLWPRPMCAISYRPLLATSGWFPMRDALCVTAAGTTLPAGQCPTDAGYLTIRR